MGGRTVTLVQVVRPRLDLKVAPGWCLKFVQDSFGAPVMHATATIAANATRYRNTSRVMPNVAVPVWFWHYGTYGGVSGEYGHVVIWVPGRGFLSSPVSGFGSLWLSSIEAVERTFLAKYRFWSQDVNTLRIAEPEPVKELDPMPKNTRITYRPKSGREIGNSWKYLTINDRGDVTVLGGGDNGRHAIVFCNVEVSGELDLRAVVEKTSLDGKKVDKTLLNYYSRVNGLGTYSIPLDIPNGYRLRFQAKSTSKSPVKVVQVGYSVDYWEK